MTTGWVVLKPIAIEKIAQPAEDTALFTAVAELGTVLDDTAGEGADRPRLQPDLPGTAEDGEEESFPTEHPVADTLDKFYIEVYGRLERDDAAGVYLEDLTGLQFFFNDIAAGMHEGESIAVEFFHDEPFPAEDTGA